MCESSPIRIHCGGSCKNPRGAGGIAPSRLSDYRFRREREGRVPCLRRVPWRGRQAHRPFPLRGFARGLFGWGYSGLSPYAVLASSLPLANGEPRPSPARIAGNTAHPTHLDAP
jgi:hypothetical protein